MNHRVFKCLTLGVLALSSFSVAIFAKEQPQVIEEAVAWSGNQTPNITESYYSTCSGKTGSALKSALSSINKPKNTSYDWSRYEDADEAENDSSSILSLYTRHTIKKSNHCGNYAWDKWNREHVFTQTKFPQSKTDNHNIFACEGKINGIRSDYPFNEINSTSYVTVFNHVTGCKVYNETFEPCDEAKGEVARACMYVTLYYPYTLDQIFVDASLCAKWHAEHPVTDREIFRNNTVYGLQGNRNPFVDHPSYANSIFGSNYTEPDPLDVPSTAPAVKSVSINPTTLDLDISGETTGTLTASVNAVNGASQEVTWSTSNSSVATVENGVVTAIGVGTATITATSTFNANRKGTCVVSVRNSQQLNPQVTAVSISPATLELDLYGTLTSSLIASVSAVDGASEDVTWSSENPDVATVENGEVTAISVGTTIIKATSTFDNTKHGSCEVTVINSYKDDDDPPVIETATLESLEVTAPNKLEYEVGEELDLTGFTATAKYSDQSSKDVTSLVTLTGYNSSNVQRQLITVSYQEGEISVSSSFVVKVIQTQKDEPKEEKDTLGCAGSLLATSAIISVSSIIGVGLLLVKKHRKFED